MKRLVMGIATVALVATAAHAQAPFVDVPRDHWAYDAVNTLASRGLVIGYPDGTFGGKRSMTRYEFAVVIARIIPQLESYIRDQVKAQGPAVAKSNLSNYVTKDQLGNYVTQADFDTLKKLVDVFTPELQMLQVDVAGLRRDLNDLRGRVATLEEEVGRVQVSGEANAIGRGTSTSRSSLKRGVFPVDIDGRSLSKRTSILDPVQVYYDMDLGVRVKATKDITANTLLNIGNYTGGFLGGNTVGPTPYPFPFGAATRGSSNAEIAPWKAYIEAPVTVRPLGLVDIEAGKTGIQFTPFTLKLIDYDSYTRVSKTDNGDVVFTGVKGRMQMGRVGLTAYAGTHGGGMNGSGFPLYITANYTPRPENPFLQQQLALFPGIPVTVASIEQSAGVRATINTPLNGLLGLSFIEGGLRNQMANNGQNLAERAQIYGADLKVNPFGGLGFAGEYASSNLQPTARFRIDNSSVYPRKLHSAYDGRLSLGVGGLSLSAGYRRVEPFFGAPGFWGSLGSWKNPTNIRGFVGSAEYAFSNRLAVVGTYDNYRSILRGYGQPVLTPGGALENSNDTRLQHFTAGLRFGLTSASRVDLGVEQVLYSRIGNAAIRPANGKPKENYYNIGLGSDLTENTSLKLLYQIIDYKDHFMSAGQDAKGNVAVAQFQVKF